ncbi:GNAT family protein [Streptomyces justiciae]|uniref:GNAT family protein n=1 Tax=Streptomyces justiciae TaxID=2780140 RepID=A0ABU3LW26_9ACTN|nr:GNAT family protein [Streptomyces justiciae]MDT7843435.1 GNAT family protein [Streptomyces justiciae]
MLFRLAGPVCRVALELHHDSGETGGNLAPGHRGQGRGTELFLPGAESAHSHTGLPTPRAGTATENLACRGALERTGFVAAPARPAMEVPR